MSQKKWLVAVIAVDENLLAQDIPNRKALTTLPDVIASAIEEASPSVALELDRVYLHDDKEKDTLITELESLSLPYHVYATEERGEACTQPFCNQHKTCVVISRHDYRQ
jgi:hypothetical protein